MFSLLGNLNCVFLHYFVPFEEEKPAAFPDSLKVPLGE